MTAEVSTEEAVTRTGYEAPAIVWREPHEPIALSVSCASNFGNPGCNPGPLTN